MFIYQQRVIEFLQCPRVVPGGVYLMVNEAVLGSATKDKRRLGEHTGDGQRGE